MVVRRARVATICEWCVRRRKNSTRDVSVICHSCPDQKRVSEQPPHRNNEEITDLERPEVQVLDELNDLAEGQDEERVVQARRRDPPHHLQHVFLGTDPAVHAKDRVPRWCRDLLRRLDAQLGDLVLVRTRDGPVEFRDVEGLDDALSRHEGLGRRFGHVGRFGNGDLLT